MNVVTASSVEMKLEEGSIVFVVSDFRVADEVDGKMK